MNKEDRKVIDNIFEKLVYVVDVIDAKMATKEDLHELKSEIYNHIDGFIKLHNETHTEVMALINKTNRIDTRLIKVERRAF